MIEGDNLSMNGLSSDIECSVLVCNYRPAWDKLHLTLRSILMQENCIYKIVIADDGSEENCFDRIREYFIECRFDKFELISSVQNMGTVFNVLQGLRACEGSLVKMISPGDFFNGKNVLRDWIDFMNCHDDCIMSFCDAIYYYVEAGKTKYISKYARPQNANIKGDGITVKQYLFYGDNCLGASSMFRKDLWIKYLEMIVGKVIYAEDYSYWIMKYLGEKFAYIPKSFLLYEYGTGISTCGSAIWKEKLQNDWKKTKEIMLLLKPCHEADRLHIKDFLQISNDRSWKNRLRRWYICPSRLLNGLKCKLFPRMTSTNVDEIFIKELLR